MWLSKILVSLFFAKECNGFSFVISNRNDHHRHHLHLGQERKWKSTIRPKTTVLLSAKATLTEDTTWNVRMVLGGVSTEQGKKVDKILNLKLLFLEEPGYEPPQGTVQLVTDDDDDDDDNDGEQQSRFQIANSYWQLSEDPKERKDGMWVWGLFKEPLYPFLLLRLQTKAIALPSKNHNNNDGNVAVAIQPLQLYAQLSHQRDEKKGVVLSPTTELKVRQVETVDVDMFGAAKVDLYNEVNIGTLSIRPISVNA